jgi:hypothetical protein
VRKISGADRQVQRLDDIARQIARTAAKVAQVQPVPCSIKEGSIKGFDSITSAVHMQQLFAAPPLQITTQGEWRAQGKRRMVTYRNIRKSLYNLWKAY